jgi:hypothetical protein
MKTLKEILVEGLFDNNHDNIDLNRVYGSYFSRFINSNKEDLDENLHVLINKLAENFPTWYNKELISNIKGNKVSNNQIDANKTNEKTKRDTSVYSFSINEIIKGRYVLLWMHPVDDEIYDQIKFTLTNGKLEFCFDSTFEYFEDDNNDDVVYSDIIYLSRSFDHHCRTIAQFLLDKNTYQELLDEIGYK